MKVEVQNKRGGRGRTALGRHGTGLYAVLSGKFDNVSVTSAPVFRSTRPFPI
jgi:hypothetical protein